MDGADYTKCRSMHHTSPSNDGSRLLVYISPTSSQPGSMNFGRLNDPELTHAFTINEIPLKSQLHGSGYELLPNFNYISSKLRILGQIHSYNNLTSS